MLIVRRSLVVERPPVVCEVFCYVRVILFLPWLSIILIILSIAVVSRSVIVFPVSFNLCLAVSVFFVLAALCVVRPGFLFFGFLLIILGLGLFLRIPSLCAIRRVLMFI